MKSFNLRSSFVFVMAVALMTAQTVRAADVWLTDLAAAKAQAATENKNIVAVVVGTAWEPGSKKLIQKALGTPEFETEAPKDFVLLKLDLPEDVRTADPKVLEGAKELGVQTIPSVLVLDAAGKTVGRTGYFAGVNGSVYLAHLKVFAADSATAAQLFADGKAATDEMVKAAKYHEAIDVLTDNGAAPSAYREEIREIVKADKGETLKYGGTVPYRQLYVSLVTQQVARLAQQGEVDKARAAFDLMVAEVTLTNEEKQMLWFGIKGRLYEVEGNLAKAVEIYNEAIAFDPTSKAADQIRAYLKELEGRQSDILDVNGAP